MSSVDVRRTPDERFDGLPDWPFEPRHASVPNGKRSLRIHYVDEGDPASAPVVMLHGEPTWSYLYRKLIPTLVDAGARVVAPDLVGFGRSDKPASGADYSYALHVEWMRALIEALELHSITLVCHDWGGLIGLRLAAENPAPFARIVAANTFMPTGDQPLGDAFHKWREFSQTVPELEIGPIVARGCVRDLPLDVVAAYDAPFPDESFKAGARRFPALVPASPDDPATAPNRAAWAVLSRWERPVLTAFGDSDPITRGADRLLQSLIPGARGMPHVTIKNAGHYLQEDKGEELASVIADFIATTPELT